MQSVNPLADAAEWAVKRSGRGHLSHLQTVDRAVRILWGKSGVSHIAEKLWVRDRRIRFRTQGGVLFEICLLKDGCNKASQHTDAQDRIRSRCLPCGRLFETCASSIWLRGLKLGPKGAQCAPKAPQPPKARQEGGSREEMVQVNER